MVVLSELSEGCSSSSSTHGHIYEVFLSFRGIDTRHNFITNLHKALMDAKITTFLDDEEIEIGEDLKPELESAIKASRASIIVLSKNYATSTWCLDELVLILEQRRTFNHVVIPIFYHVEPTHIRKQQSSFGDAMDKHRQKMEGETKADKRSKWAQKIEQWSKSLTEVADLKGKYVNDRQEMQFIEEIVNDIYRILRVHLRSPLPLLIGMESSITFITSWLKDASSHTTDILTILGMGGIGKTSLAKFVYGLDCRDFKTSSYIGNISSRCDENFSGLLDLQKQLCDDISKTSPIPADDVSIYTSKIENVVARKKVFLVLDDIDSVNQLDALLGSKGFYPGSKIIITTKDAWLTESCALFKMNVKPNHVKHLLQGLHVSTSRKLLCLHAFTTNQPEAGYEEVLEKFVEYCEGHPLALEVLGKSLHNRDVAYWEDTVKGLKKEVGSHINNVLRSSFDSLPLENDKELFKHIACFFVGRDKDDTETILKACDINIISGITNLIDRCLLSIGWHNELVMHQLLQKMGRFVVYQESPHKPWKRSRLWCDEESLKVLKQKKDMRNLLGLALDMRRLEKAEKLCASFELKTNVLSNMDSLILLQLNFVQLSGSYANFPEDLKWLCMHGSPLKSIPLNLPMENLVSLHMSYSNIIESFDICYSNPQRVQKRQKLDGSCLKDKRLLGALKILNLSFCEQLHSLGGFDQLPALERLIVTNCINLVEVCESIEQCVELVLIDFSYCKKLRELPRNMSMLKKVKMLLLKGCNFGESQINTRDMDSSEKLKTTSLSINTITTFSVVQQAIPSDLKLLTVSLPRSLVSLALQNNKLSTESFPIDFSSLFMLEELYLDDNPIVSLPSCVRSLPRIKILSMQNCEKLMSLENPPHTLRELMLVSDYRPALRKVLFDQNMSPLKFYIEWRMFAPSSFEIEGVVKIQPMASAEKMLLRCLGWIELNFFKERRLRTDSVSRGIEESEIQMYYEFGIFSTIFEGNEMPNWITERSQGTSISFTIPSSSKKLIGLNFCFVNTLQIGEGDSIYTPMIKISNITKNLVWIYQHYIDAVDGGCLMFLSHWMFGMNEMEGGDHVVITMSKKPYDRTSQVAIECGVSFVYDDGITDEEKLALSYYKSWNHIIGRDLTGFQLTTGEYLLSMERFMIHVDDLLIWDRHLVGDGARFKDKLVNFRAFP